MVGHLVPSMLAACAASLAPAASARFSHFIHPSASHGLLQVAVDHSYDISVISYEEQVETKLSSTDTGQKPGSLSPVSRKTARKHNGFKAYHNMPHHRAQQCPSDRTLTLYFSDADDDGRGVVDSPIHSADTGYGWWMLLVYAKVFLAFVEEYLAETYRTLPKAQLLAWRTPVTSSSLSTSQYLGICLWLLMVDDADAVPLVSTSTKLSISDAPPYPKSWDEWTELLIEWLVPLALVMTLIFLMISHCILRARRRKMWTIASSLAVISSIMLIHNPNVSERNRYALVAFGLISILRWAIVIMPGILEEVSRWAFLLLFGALLDIIVILLVGVDPDRRWDQAMEHLPWTYYVDVLLTYLVMTGDPRFNVSQLTAIVGSLSDTAGRIEQAAKAVNSNAAVVTTTQRSAHPFGRGINRICDWFRATLSGVRNRLQPGSSGTDAPTDASESNRAGHVPEQVRNSSGSGVGRQEDQFEIGADSESESSTHGSVPQRPPGQQVVGEQVAGG